jgi:hypothetical protein
MFLFISYTLPSTPFSTYSLAVELEQSTWLNDQGIYVNGLRSFNGNLDYGMHFIACDIINKIYPKVNVEYKNIVGCPYISKFPKHKEDVWRYAMLDGKILNYKKQEIS